MYSTQRWAYLALVSVYTCVHAYVNEEASKNRISNSFLEKTRAEMLQSEKGFNPVA